MSKKTNIEEIELYIQLAFELGQAYQNIYEMVGLDNVIDFNDIAFANSKGAMWNLKGDMSDLPELFKIHKLKQDGIDELNKINKNLEYIKFIAKRNCSIVQKATFEEVLELLDTKQ